MATIRDKETLFDTVAMAMYAYEKNEDEEELKLALKAAVKYLNKTLLAKNIAKYCTPEDLYGPAGRQR